MVTMKSKSLRGSLFQRKSNSRSAQLPKSLSVQMAPAVKLHSRNGNSTLGRKGTYDRQIPTKQIEQLSLSKEVRFLVEKNQTLLITSRTTEDQKGLGTTHDKCHLSVPESTYFNRDKTGAESAFWNADAEVLFRRRWSNVSY